MGLICWRLSGFKATIRLFCVKYQATNTSQREFMDRITFFEVQVNTPPYEIVVVECERSYRPQRSCGKVMFLHLSVSHSVYGGMGVWQTPPGQIPPKADTPRADTPPGQTPPGRHLPRQTPPVDSYCSGWYASFWNALSLQTSMSMQIKKHWRCMNFSQWKPSFYWQL